MRPEKIRLLTEDAATSGDDVTVGGVGADVVYLGSATHSIVDLDGGGRLSVMQQNLESSLDHALARRGEKVPAQLAPQQRRRPRPPRRAHREGRRPNHRGEPMNRLRRQKAVTMRGGACALALGLTACGGSSDAGGGGGAQGSGFTAPDVAMKDSLGDMEGEVNILAWPGYAEDGSTDKAVDWVTPFEKATGCEADIKYFGTSDEAVNLMKTGEYDVVSASGDASLRLIAAGDVAPVNTDLLKNYGDICRLPQGPRLELRRRPDVRRPARLGRQPADVAHRQGQAGPDQLVGGVRPGRGRRPARSRRTTRRSTSPTPRST